MRTEDARAIDETEQRFYPLNARRDDAVSDRERPALEWTEAITHVAIPISPMKYTMRSRAFYEAQLVALVAVTSGQPLTGGDAMTYVDSAVLDLTERTCRLFQAWTGRTNVWLAFQLTNLSIVVYFVWAAGLYLVSGDLVLRIFVALVCGGVFFALTRTVFNASIETSESAAYRRVAKGLRNPRRVRDAQLRIAFLTLSIVLSYPLWFAYITLHLRFVVLTEALIILTTVVLYVLACDPLPPCTGKAMAWLRANIGRSRQPITEIQDVRPSPTVWSNR